jgi:hypothetical protein
MPESENQPYALSKVEWQEIAELPEVREAWGLNEETGEDFAEITYGVKFKFVSGIPGYTGDLYILQGDTLTGDPTWQFIREDGKLKLI